MTQSGWLLILSPTLLTMVVPLRGGGDGPGRLSVLLEKKGALM